MKRWLTRTGLSFVWGAVACTSREVPAPPPPPVLEVVRVEPQEVPLSADFVGTIDGIENAEIRARVPGYVQSVDYREGSRVSPGDLLFTLDPVLARAAVQQARGDLELALAELDRAKLDVDRLEPLAATKAVSRQEYDHAVAARDARKARVEAARGALETAEANLEYTRVTSPIEGIAGLKEVSVGTLVGQNEPTLLTTVSRLDTVRVRFPIAEQIYLKYARELNQLAAGKAEDARLRLILADGSMYPKAGELALIDRAVQVATGTIALEAHFPNPDNVLRPGQFARVRIYGEPLKDALAVPQRAVMERQSLKELYVVGSQGEVEVREVRTGPRVASFWVIERGIKAGERVVVEGMTRVKPGQHVEVKEVPLGSVREVVEKAGEVGAERGEAPK